MIGLELEPLEAAPLELVPKEDRERGWRAAGTIESRMTLGQPLIHPVEGLGPEAVSGGVHSAAQAHFAIVRTAVSLWPATDERFERVWVSLALDPPTNSLSESPVIWSMT